MDVCRTERFLLLRSYSSEVNLINVVYFLANGLGAVGQMATAVAAPYAVSRWVLAATARKSKIAISRQCGDCVERPARSGSAPPTGMIRQPSPTAAVPLHDNLRGVAEILRSDTTGEG